jgi:hypothetical protein
LAERADFASKRSRAYFYNRWSLEADERKSKASKEPVGGQTPPA